MFGIPDQVSAIEIMGCCNAISEGLLSQLRNILPDTRITTVKQLVSTQLDTNRLMQKVSLSFLVIVLIVGAISIGNYIWANVNERRKEIGILRMIGAPKSSIYGMLFGKAVDPRSRRRRARVPARHHGRRDPRSRAGRARRAARCPSTCSGPSCSPWPPPSSARSCRRGSPRRIEPFANMQEV